METSRDSATWFRLKIHGCASSPFSSSPSTTIATASTTFHSRFNPITTQLNTTQPPTNHHKQTLQTRTKHPPWARFTVLWRVPARSSRRPPRSSPRRRPRSPRAAPTSVTCTRAASSTSRLPPAASAR